MANAKKSENTVLKVATGAKRYSITDEMGDEIGSFKFNPTDANILKRYREVYESIDKLRDELPKDGGESNADTVVSFGDMISDRFDYLFGYHAASDIFACCGPLTVNDDGEVFFAVMLNAIAEIIENATESRISKMKTKIGKYSGKYRK